MSAAPSRYVSAEEPLERAAPDILRLWGAFLGGMTPEVAAAKLRDGYLENPAGRGLAVLLRSEEAGGAIGVIGVHPRRMAFESKRIDGATLSDYAVEDAHRTLGPAVKLMRTAVTLSRSRFQVLLGLPNPKSEAVCRRLGLEPIGALDRYVHVLRSRPYLGRRVPALLLGPVSWLADLAMSLRRYWGLRRSGNAVRLDSSSFDDPVLDEIWARRPRQLLLGERSAAMQQWRYGPPSRGAWRLHVARDASRAPVGYVIWRIRDGEAEVGDLFCVDFERHLAPLATRFLQLAHHLGARSASMRMMGSQAQRLALERAGFRRRGKRRTVFLAHSTLSEVASPAVWYLTAFDSDAN